MLKKWELKFEGEPVTLTSKSASSDRRYLESNMDIGPSLNDNDDWVKGFASYLHEKELETSQK